MGFNFPDIKFQNQTFTPLGGPTYTWNGFGWDLSSSVITSPILTGDAKAPTPVFGDSDSSISTTAFTQAAIGAAFPPQCGRLVYASGSTIKLIPWNGDRIRINGVIYQIPAAGVSLISSNCSPGSTYLVLAYASGGVPALTVVLLSSYPHYTDTTPGNVGTEVAYSSNYTLVGMVRVNASNQFVDSASQRFVLSWFNRRLLCLQGAYQGLTITFGPWNELSAGNRLELLCWGDEDVFVAMGGCSSHAEGSIVSYFSIQVDATTNYTVPTVNSYFVYGGYYNGAESQADGLSLAEGYHYITHTGGVSGGTGYFYVTLSGFTAG